jgi:hypothetical protein
VTAIPYPFEGGPPLPVRALKFLALAAFIAFAALMTFAISSLAFAAPVLALCIVLVLAYAAFRWPTQTIMATLVLVPLSRFLSLLVFSATGSSMAVRASQLIKDELIVVLLIAVANQAFSRRKAPTIYLFDLAIAAYIGFAFMYLFYPGASGEGTNILGKVLAWRQDALYFMAYFIGRGMTLNRRTLETMVKVLVVLSVVLALVALVQTALPNLSNAAFNWLGFSKFMAVIGSPHEKLVVRSRGIAGADFSRSSSLFLADLGLAFFQVLIIPFAAALYFTAKKRGAQVGYGFFLVLMIGVLATTITRSAVLAAAIGLAFVTIRTAGYAKAWPVAAALALLAMPVIVFAHLTPDSIGALLSTKEGSASAHLSLLQEGLAQFKEHPWGIGLGNGSHVANLVAKFGVTLPVTAAESWYLQIALEMGIIALALFTLMLLAAIAKATLASFYVSDPLLKVITIGVAGAGLSLAVSGIFQPVWAGVHVSYLFWLFAGIAARAVTLEREWAADASDVLPPEFTRDN